MGDSRIALCLRGHGFDDRVDVGAVPFGLALSAEG